MRSLSLLVSQSYATRACFVCAALGVCQHREFAVEAAIIEAEINRPLHRKPPMTEQQQPKERLRRAMKGVQVKTA